MSADPVRSRIMRSVRRANTNPELAVRKSLHAFGLRYRIHRKDLPGTPDIVFPSQRLAIFIHGCFWHRHVNCAASSTPKTNVEFWQKKFAANVLRDARNSDALKSAGWRVMTVWECETNKPASLNAQIKKVRRALARKRRSKRATLSNTVP
jgi:DNA mismatch endonuclease, patch repair protein